MRDEKPSIPCLSLSRSLYDAALSLDQTVAARTSASRKSQANIHSRCEGGVTAPFQFQTVLAPALPTGLVARTGS